MSITLNDGTTTITLNPDLLWSDENTWHPVEQNVERTITGAMVVSVAARVGGRPITLEPETEESAWMSLATVNAVRNWAAVPGKVMTLTLRGLSYSVIFRHQDGGLDAKPLVHYSDANNADYYLCVVRLMEI